MSSASLFLTRLAPGDYAVDALGIGAGRERLASMRAQYGLDRPFIEQYGSWLGGALRFDFGRSLAYDRPVSDVIPERAANTALLATTALLIATLVGVPLGVVAGSRRAGAMPTMIRIRLARIAFDAAAAHILVSGFSRRPVEVAADWRYGRRWCGAAAALRIPFAI